MKRKEDNTRERTSLEFAKSKRGSVRQRKIGEAGREGICGAPSTLVVKV